MYPGLPSRLEREIKQLYLERVLKVSDRFFWSSCRLINIWVSFCRAGKMAV